MNQKGTMMTSIIRIGVSPAIDDDDEDEEAEAPCGAAESWTTPGVPPLGWAF
jgi:hypothetical protein